MSYADRQAEELIINKLSQNKFSELKNEGLIDDKELYIRKDSELLGLPKYDNTKKNQFLKVSSDGNDIEWTADVAGVGAKFETINEMIVALNNAPNTAYQEGQTIYIVEREVPDFWVYSVENESVQGYLPDNWDIDFYRFGYYVISPLEPTKVLVNSNITYSDEEPKNPKIGDLWLSPTTAQLYELPAFNEKTAGKVLGVNIAGSLEWTENIATVDVGDWKMLQSGKDLVFKFEG